MRIAQIIGTVTLNRSHPTFQAARLRVALPMSLESLTKNTPPDPAGMCVCWDEIGTGIGSRVAMTEGPEAAQPFRPQLKPVDAYVAALLDEVDLGGIKENDQSA